MTPVTDPALLAQLNGSVAPQGLQPVTDPELLKQLNGQVDQPVTATGLAKSAGTGLVRGAEYLAGLPGDLGKGVDWLFDKVSGPATPEQKAQLSALRPPSSTDVINAETKVTGGLHPAGNKAEQAVENIASFIPASLGGPEALAVNALKRGILPGVASEAAGQATAGTPLEPYARMAGALVQKGAAVPTPASSADLIAAGGRGFDAFRVEPFAATPDAMSTWAKDRLSTGSFQQGYTANTAPLTTDLLKEYAGRNASAVSANELDELKDRLRTIQATATGREKSAATDAIVSLNDRIKSFGPAETAVGNPAQAASLWRDANANTAAGKTAQQFEDIATKATDQASAANSGLNSGNKIRGAYSNALNDSRKTLGMTDSEVAALQKIVDGTTLGNTTRYLANTLGGGGGIGGLVAGRIIGGVAGAGAGAAADGGRGALEGGTIGAMILANLLRRSYNSSVTGQAARLSAQIRARAPLSNTPAVGLHITPGVQRILNMSHAIQVAHGND